MNTSTKRNNSNKRKETEETQTKKTEKRAKINDNTTVEGILSFFIKGK